MKMRNTHVAVRLLTVFTLALPTVAQNNVSSVGETASAPEGGGLFEEAPDASSADSENGLFADALDGETTRGDLFETPAASAQSPATGRRLRRPSRNPSVSRPVQPRFGAQPNVPQPYPRNQQSIPNSNFLDVFVRPVGDPVLRLQAAVLNTDDEETQKSKLEELKKELEGRFDSSLAVQESELKQLENRVKKLRQAVETRKKNRERIIENFLDSVRLQAEGLTIPGINQRSRYPTPVNQVHPSLQPSGFNPVPLRNTRPALPPEAVSPPRVPTPTAFPVR